MVLCTDCNKPVKPVIAIDIDGTLAEYHSHFFKFASGWFGRQFNHNYSGRGTLAEYMKVDPLEYRQCKLAYRQGGMKRTMPMYRDAKGFISRIQDLEAEIWITTTRPYLRLDNVDPDTREWLERNKIEYTGLIYDDDKYAKLLEIVGPDRVVGVIDDLPDNYDRAEELGLRPIMVERFHNHSTPRSPRLNMLQIETLLYNRVQGWYGLR